MDIDAFKQSVAPRSKRSKIEPHKEAVLTLKEQGYTNKQIKEYLDANNVSVSVEAVRKFINAQDANALITSNKTTLNNNVSAKTEEVKIESKEIDSNKLDEVFTPVDTKTEREQAAKKYFSRSNSVLDIINKNEGKE